MKRRAPKLRLAVRATRRRKPEFIGVNQRNISSTARMRAQHGAGALARRVVSERHAARLRSSLRVRPRARAGARQRAAVVQHARAVPEQAPRSQRRLHGCWGPRARGLVPTLKGTTSVSKLCPCVSVCFGWAARVAATDRLTQHESLLVSKAQPARPLWERPRALVIAFGGGMRRKCRARRQVQAPASPA